LCARNKLEQRYAPTTAAATILELEKKSISDEFIEFFNCPNLSNRNMSLWSTQPVTEMSTSYLPGGKARPARKTDNFTAICEPLFRKCWNLDVSQLYGPPPPGTGIALPFFYHAMKTCDGVYVFIYVVYLCIFACCGCMKRHTPTHHLLAVTVIRKFY
jgi:hypothetical protein